MGALAAPRAVAAPGRKVLRIGVLSPFTQSDGPAPSFQVFRDTLRELGHVEGENLAFEYRWADGKYERLPPLAAELAQSKVDVVLSAWSTPAALAAKRATSTIPIVFVGVGDAVGVGLVASLARPGGHVTGSTFLSEETVGKLLQLLKEVVPPSPAWPSFTSAPPASCTRSSRVPSPRSCRSSSPAGSSWSSISRRPRRSASPSHRRCCCEPIRYSSEGLESCYPDAMKLTSAQLEQFDRDGYLFFPSLFTPEEIKALTDEVPALYAQHRPENVREKGSDAVRTNFAAHMYSAPFARLARHPRMIDPVVQVFGEPVYMHQFKINGKMAFDGDVWQWHQDFGTWFNDDQMPEARAMNVAIFLDAVNEFNGPLMFIPGSHKLGVLDAGHDTTTTSYPLWTIDHATITRLIERGGLVAPKGPAGSMIMFHSCLVHASTSNLSPWNRVSVYLSLCAVSNHIRRFKRPEYIAHRDFTPIERLPDDCLLRPYEVALPWKDGTPEAALR
jgi:ectoine hydroxylase